MNASRSLSKAYKGGPAEPAPPDGIDLMPDTEAIEGADLLAQL
ncbi:hypothetical protein OG535_29245 [Kitasatospora sp. NBC_00085]